MYQALVVRGANAQELIVFVRNWCRPLWGMLSLLWLAVLGTLFALYVSPSCAPPTAHFNGVEIDLDKFFHFLAHAGTIALPLAIVPHRWLAMTMVGIAIFCGVAFECCQLFVPERTFDFADLTANFAGLLVGARSGRFVRELYPRLP